VIRGQFIGSVRRASRNAEQRTGGVTTGARKFTIISTRVHTDAHAVARMTADILNYPCSKIPFGTATNLVSFHPLRPKNSSHSGDQTFKSLARRASRASIINLSSGGMQRSALNLSLERT